MRARLQQLSEGKGFQFICDAAMAAKMDRVVMIGGGEILSTEERPDGTVVQVVKKGK